MKPSGTLGLSWWILCCEVVGHAYVFVCSERERERERSEKDFSDTVFLCLHMQVGGGCVGGKVIRRVLLCVRTGMGLRNKK